ncbi:hypothetical protein FA13DRAFT_1843217 [Coprinellus micaceus]|uniref:Uncharacterized protein n=1 Tax=Coprinellus micaceus TaxID=71717 RepID=A0A4Y7TD89_COPMI|nr:hypothetical protein FA13DRAFT_1843217 [Coprinellus micaceus]
MGVSRANTNVARVIEGHLTTTRPSGRSKGIPCFALGDSIAETNPQLKSVLPNILGSLRRQTPRPWIGFSTSDSRHANSQTKNKLAHEIRLEVWRVRAAELYRSQFWCTYLTAATNDSDESRVVMAARRLCGCARCGARQAQSQRIADEANANLGYPLFREAHTAYVTTRVSRATTLDCVRESEIEVRTAVFARGHDRGSHMPIDPDALGAGIGSDLTSALYPVIYLHFLGISGEKCTDPHLSDDRARPFKLSVVLCAASPNVLAPKARGDVTLRLSFVATPGQPKQHLPDKGTPTPSVASVPSRHEAKHQIASAEPNATAQSGITPFAKRSSRLPHSEVPLFCGSGAEALVRCAMFEKTAWDGGDRFWLRGSKRTPFSLRSSTTHAGYPTGIQWFLQNRFNLCANALQRNKARPKMERKLAASGGVCGLLDSDDMILTACRDDAGRYLDSNRLVLCHRPPSGQSR